MAIQCTRCEGTGFLNLFQVDDADEMNREQILNWIEDEQDHDVSVCDCCGDTENWHGSPGEHYTADDPPGNNGPYVYNGGFCECH